MPSKGRRWSNRPPLTIEQILAWADEHYRRTGSWPTVRSGPVYGAPPGQTWRAIQAALRHGCRGLPGGDSLAQLLRRERGLPERRGRPADTARRALVAQLREQGLTLAEIGRRLGISRQAVFQLLRSYQKKKDAVA
jgi:DNA-binding NarL/FixJ family response regulator